MTQNRAERTTWLLLSTAAAARNHLNQLLKRYEQTTTGFFVLRAVRQAHTPPTITDLTRSITFENPDMTRLLDKLETEGWIYRTRTAPDRRQVCVHITDEGRAALSEVEELVAAACEHLTKFFDESDMIGLTDHFRSILDAAEEKHA